jgi:hypothetical protein
VKSDLIGTFTEDEQELLDEAIQIFDRIPSIDLWKKLRNWNGRLR